MDLRKMNEIKQTLKAYNSALNEVAYEFKSYGIILGDINESYSLEWVKNKDLVFRVCKGEGVSFVDDLDEKTMLAMAIAETIEIRAGNMYHPKLKSHEYERINNFFDVYITPKDVQKMSKYL